MTSDKQQKIISLVPSITELLYDLELEEQVVGITKFCVHPNEWFRTKTRIGGTKQIHIEKIKTLEPSLIIASKEENVKEQVEALSNFAEILLTDVVDYASALEMIEAVGNASFTKDKAKNIRYRIEEEFRQLSVFLQHQQLQSLPCAYLIWKDPYMVAGGDTFIHSMLQQMGCMNSYAKQNRYPSVVFEATEWQEAKIILLSSEPYPFTEKHIIELTEQFPEKTFLLVDGEMFSWYGSRMLQAPSYFISLLNELTQLG